MAYIEAHQSLRDHRKILALAAELDMLEPHVGGHCLWLWLWSLDNAEEGRLPDSVRIIERAAGWQGESGVLVAAMIKVNMLDQTEDGAIYIHDWWDYAGRLIEKRKSDAERKRVARAQPAPPAPSTGHPTDGARTSYGRRADGAGTVPNRTLTNRTLSSSSDESGVTCALNASDGATNGATIRADAHTHTPASDDTSQPVAETLAPQKRKAAKALTPTPASTAAPSSTPRSANPLWDALVEIFGYEPRTRQERSNWGGIVKDLKAASATADEVRQAKATYDERVALGIINWSLTPNALPNHFAELLQPTRTPTVSRPRTAGGGPVRHEPPTMIPASQANQWWVTPQAGAPPPARRTAAMSAPNGAPSGASAPVATPDATADDCAADALRSPPGTGMRGQTIGQSRPPLQVIAAS